MKRFTTTSFAFLLAIGFAPVSAEPPRCTPVDVITIKDAGPGRAIVTYNNSFNECSREVLIDMKTEAGISVRISVKLGDDTNDYRETIIVQPLDPAMMSFPPEAEVVDGETVEIIVQGGMS